MKVAFDPPASVAAATPEAENTASLFTKKNIWSGAAAEGDDDSSPWPCTCPGSNNLIKPLGNPFGSCFLFCCQIIFRSRPAGDGVKSEEDADFLSHANRALSFLVC